MHSSPTNLAFWFFILSLVCTFAIILEYSSGSAPYQCSLCGEGKFQDEEGSTLCKTCAEGSHTDTTIGALICEPCPPGFHLGAKPIDKSTCEHCQGGYFEDEAGKAKCNGACPAGKYIVSGPHVSINQCKACRIGYYEDQQGQSECKDPCPAGKYDDSVSIRISADDCKSCNISCSVGKQMECNRYSGPSCVKCPKGSYKGLEGPSVCLNCTKDGYEDTLGATACKKCPSGASFDNSAYIHGSKGYFDSSLKNTQTLQYDNLRLDFHDEISEESLYGFRQEEPVLYCKPYKSIL
eukprot:UC4_evm1s1376